MTTGAGVDPARLLREVSTVAVLELQSLAFGVRALLSLVLYGGFALIVATGYLFITDKIEEQVLNQNPALAQQDRKALLDQMLKSDDFQKQVMPVLEQVGGEAFAKSVAEDSVPWIVIVLMLFTSLAIPGLVLVMTYDRISEDLSTKYARFVLQRVHRGSYLFGKILGQWITILVSMMLVHLLLLGLGAALGKKIDTPRVLAVLPQVWLALSVFVLAYTALASLFSALITPPFAALAFGGMALMGLFVMKHLIAPFGMIWMGTWDTKLWFGEPAAFAVYAAHAVLLGAGAFAILRWRDV
ncbi:MAG: ABC transporter permease [Myxococcota bacterium]